jgi:nitrate reductase beta subunit
VGRIRYLGVILYDADRIAEAASVENEQDLYEAQLDIMLDPHDPEVIAEARKAGINDEWLDAARRSPIYKMVHEWRVAFPLHPEYRTLPMVWYVPPLSPIQSAAEAGHIGFDGQIPDLEKLQIPVRYLANMLTAGDTGPVVAALKKMFAMRIYNRSVHVEGVPNVAVLAEAGLSVSQVDDMYRYFAIANIEDRFVIPTSARAEVVAAEDLQGSCGISFGGGCGDGGCGSSGGGKAEDRKATPIRKLFQISGSR